MPKIAERLNALSESQTIAMAKKARELKAEGVPVISLSLGEPDFNTPASIKEAAKRAIDEDFSHYTAVPGYDGLIRAIQTKFQRDNGLTYHANQIMASTGAKQSLVNVLLALVNPGDEVILPSPYWVSYMEMIKIAEGNPVLVEGKFENEFRVTAAQIEDAITPKTKLIFLNSPSNPTGSVYTPEELEEIASVLRKYPEVMVLSDEIYEHICYDTPFKSFASLPGMYDRTITVNGVSKAFAMTGWRLGYLAGPEWLVSACVKMQGQFTSATSSITQKAAEAALIANPNDLVGEMLSAFRQRRDYVYQRLLKIPGIEVHLPEGAFYLFPKISSFFGKSKGSTKIETSNDLCVYLLNEAHVALVTGEAFGAPNCLRISFATGMDDLEKACNAMEKALNELN